MTEPADRTPEPDGPTETASGRPVTGDPGVDRVLAQLEEALERASRTADHGGTADPDGTAEHRGSRDHGGTAEPHGTAGSATGAPDPVAAVTEAHRQLQARLTSPPPAAPGQARPGPR